MFRKEALRKGVLKTINANTGVMVGQPYTSAPVPAIRKPPTAFERFKVSGPVRGIKSLGRQTVNPAILGGYYAGDKVAQGLGIESPVGRMGFGLGGSYAAARMLPAVAGLGTLPSLAILGTAYGGKKLYDAGVKERARINAMSPAERKAFEIEQRNSAFDYMNVSDEELFGKFVPKAPEPIDTKKSAAAPKEGPGSGRPSMRVKSKELKAEGDPLLQDNVANSDDIANLDSVQENSLGAGTPTPPGEDGITNYTSTLSEDRERREAEALLTAPEKKAQKAESTAQGNNEITLGGPSDDVDFNKTIALARKYQEEVFKNEGSQAGLVFLANLASGLLTGTTKRGGLAGAMEVFGQAIGPAVNNYATIKLKEGELRARNREASLNAAVDHMKFLNDNANAEVEYPERTGGVIQIRGADGRLRNYKGYSLKDGTKQMAMGVGADGREQFVTVSQGTPIEDSQGNVIGKFEDFKEQKTINTRLTDLHDILGNRYDALATAREVLGIVGQEDAKAGAALTVDTFTRRMLGVGKELLGGSTMLDLDSEMSNLQTLYKDEIAALDRALAAGEITESEYEKDKKALDVGEFEKGGLLDDARKRILKNSGAKGFYSNLSRDDQETLAVYETKLVYALANTFKDQDRLTQRDINAAKEIVNIFSLARSSADVKASIQAIARGLESDIRRQEKLFTAAGGLESSLQDLRTLKDFTPFDSQADLAGTLSKDLGIEEITKELEKLEL